MLKHLKDLAQGKTTRGKRRSSKWPKLRKQFILDNPKCAICESTSKLEVHHIIPFSVDPSLELEISNLIPLCENGKYGSVCHQLYGHLGNYRRHNPDCVKDAEEWNKKIKG